MNKKLLICVGLTLCIISILKNSKAQEFSGSGVNIGVNAGGAILIGEIKNDFSALINEFQHKVGGACGFEISKYLSKKWEIGGEIDYTVLNGYTNSPEFSIEGLHFEFTTDIVDPVEYKNKLLGFNFHFRYFFKDPGTESKFFPFIRSGVGYLKYFSEVKYVDAPADSEPLFGKGGEGFTSLSTPVFFLGTGFKTQFNQNFYFISSVSFNFVSYDFLDVMHNYTLERGRQKITGLYTVFKIGIYYNLLFSRNTNNGPSKGNHLPFSK